MAIRQRRELALRLLAEIVVIVVGVLIALGVDGWAERQDERTRETAALVTMGADLQASVEALRRSNQGMRRRADLIQRVLDDPIDRPGLFPSDSLADFVTAMNVTSAYSPILRTYDALIATGALSLLENDSIQFGLADLRRMADEYLDYREQTTDHWLFTLNPIFLRWLGDSNRTQLPPPDLSSALRDREFRGAADIRSTFLDISAAQGERMADRMDELIRLVGEDLDPDN